MKKIILATWILLPFFLEAQDFKFYFNGKDIEHNTFNIKSDSIAIKTSFINNTKFKFNISSVLVVLRVPKKAEGPVQQKYSGVVETKNEVVANSSKKFSAKPSFTFNLKSLLDKYDYGCEDCEIVFKINKFTSDSNEGNSWIDEHLFFKEVTLRKSIVDNPEMGRKGN
ncbi:MAG TPA: hypothetical protein VGG71_00275 [Chitinophagaceae bacterium]